MRKKISGVMYAIGYVGISIMMQTIVKWYQYFYSPPEANKGGLRLLIPLGLIGFAMIIARLFDGIADPLVAHYSDNAKGKMGRRIPFILYGSLPLTVTFILIWFPPVQGESIWNFIYLTAMLSLYFIFFTIVVGPYLALIGEITKTKKERINLTMLMGITQVIGVMIAEAGSGVIIDMANYKVMGIILGLISLATLILTPIFIKEDQALVKAQKPVKLTASVMMTLKNKNFMYYLLPYLAIWFGINTLTIALPYITEILLGIKPEDSGFMIAGAFVIAILFSPFLPKLTLKYGKKNIMIGASLLFGILLILIGFFGTLFNVYVSSAIVLLAGIPLSAALVVPNAMVADIAEIDGAENNLRREGMFFGAQGLLNKIILGISSLVTPLLFGFLGNTRANPLGLQIVGPVAGIILIASILILRKYSIDDRVS